VSTGFSIEFRKLGFNSQLLKPVSESLLDLLLTAPVDNENLRHPGMNGRHHGYGQRKNQDYQGPHSFSFFRKYQPHFTMVTLSNQPETG
jgi:hypothetical protein